MSISLDQYRATIGLHNVLKTKCSFPKCNNHKLRIFSFWFDLLLSLNTKLSNFVLKFGLFLAIMNYFFDILHDCIRFNTFYVQQDSYISVAESFSNQPPQRLQFENYRILIGCFAYSFIKSFEYVNLSLLKGNYSYKKICSRLFFKKNLKDKLINLVSIALLCLNLLLIGLTIPNIKNPGPLSSINVLYHNVRGFVDLMDNTGNSLKLYKSKVKEFHGHIFSQKPDVVILNETWLKKSILSSEIFPNDSYKVFRRDRSKITHPPDLSYPKKFKRNGGGVIIAVRSDLDIESTDYVVSGGGVSKAEILSVILKPKTGKNISITTLYRVGTLGAENLSEVNRHMRSLFKAKPNAHHIFIGDFNLSQTKWPDGSTSCNVERGLVDLLLDLNFDQLIKTPTHKDGKILDLLCTNQPSIISELSIHPSNMVCSSDHNSIGFRLNLKCKRLKSPKRKIYNMKKGDFNSINFELKNVPWEYVLDYNDINLAIDKFEEIFFAICDKFIPVVTVKSSFQPPWFDSELDKICKHKTRLLNKKKGSTDPAVISQIDEEVKKVRNNFKKMSDKKKMENVINDEDPALIKKKFWSFYKTTSNSTRIPETLNYGSKVRSTNKGVADLFNQYFYDQFSIPSNYNIDIDFSNDPFSDEIFDDKSIFDLLMKINVNKAAGPDKIDSKLMKYCAKGLSRPLSILFNQIFKSGRIPDKWKLANVVPVLKKGNKTSVTNYRPISLTSLPMKILEYCIKDLINRKCGHLIKDTQHGFSVDKSCLTQLLPLIDKFSVAMNNKSRVDIIYFDFAKAFDSVNHDLILFKLKNKFGIDGLLLQFIKNYLQNRHQRVVINGSLSGRLPVSSGVPQGSILGPLLFILFIDDICDEISDNTNIEIYADDTKIWREIFCDEDQIELQHDIDKLHEWSVKNLMKFHPDKCKAMAITNKCLDYPLPFYEFWYHLDKKLLCYTDSEKDLGILIDHKLSWTSQCETAVKKANKQFNLLRRTCYFIKDSRQRRALYLTLVRSIFEHCCQIWSPQNPTSLDLFDKLQKRAIKWIVNEQQESYSDIVFLNKQKELDVLPMKHKFLFSDLVLFYKILKDEVKIKLPFYISRIESQDVKSVTRSSKPIRDGKDTLKYKCLVQPKVKCFQDCYFFRTVKNWNELPYELRSTDSTNKFKILLKEHLWLILGLEPD